MKNRTLGSTRGSPSLVRKVCWQVRDFFSLGFGVDSVAAGVLVLEKFCSLHCTFRTDEGRLACLLARMCSIDGNSPYLTGSRNVSTTRICRYADM